MAENGSKSPDPLLPGSARVLFVGLGTMGLPMATNLVRAGFDVSGYDANRRKVEAFVSAGGHGSDDVRLAAAGRDVIVSMLPDDQVVTDVLAGANGLIGCLRPDTLVIEMSTTGPRTKEALLDEAAARGVGFIECPVGKTVDQAVAGTLSLMAGGEALDAPMHQGEAAFALLGQALEDGYAADDIPGAMLRTCEARAGVHLAV